MPISCDCPSQLRATDAVQLWVTELRFARAPGSVQLSESLCLPLPSATSRRIDGPSSDGPPPMHSMHGRALCRCSFCQNAAWHRSHGRSSSGCFSCQYAAWHRRHGRASCRCSSCPCLTCMDGPHAGASLFQSVA
eukprot:143071-Chlamydomonas_euryale.AAC.4